MKWSYMILFFYAFIFTSCKKDKAASPVVTVQPTNTPAPNVVNCDSVSIDFVTVIQPLVVSNCSTSGCHDALGSSAGVVLETYAQISAKSDRVLGTMKQIPGYTPMPKFQNKLADSSIQKVECWINKGKPQ